MGMVNQLLDGEYTGSTFLLELAGILSLIMTVVGTLFVLYAVYICYLFFTATDEGKRKNAKSRLLKVISSVVIVYIMALSLKLIDVHFTKVEADNVDGGGNGPNWSSTVYEYSEVPVLKLSTTQKNSFKIDPSKIKIQGNDVILGGAKFTSFKFVGLESTDVLNMNAVAQTPYDSVYSVQNGVLTYYYQAPAAGQGTETAEGKKTQNTYRMKVKVGSKFETKFVVYAAATFEYAGVKNCVVNFFVELKIDDPLIHNNPIANVPESSL